MLNIIKESLLKVLILSGFTILLLKLLITGQLNLYLHPRFTILLEITAAFFALMLVQELRHLQCLRKNISGDHAEDHHTKWWPYFPFILALLIIFLLPTTSLNASLIKTRGLYNQTSANLFDVRMPSTAQLRQASFITITDHNYVGIMGEFRQHPEYYVGKQIDMTGFAFKNKADPGNYASLVRYIVNCCTADAVPYGILCDTNDFQFENEKWYEVQGILQNYTYKGKNILVIKVDWAKQIDQTKSPYVFP